MSRANVNQTLAQWQGLQDTFSVEFRFLPDSDTQQFVQLTESLMNHDFYRVVFDGNLRRLGRHYRHLKNIPRLIINDHDVCHHFSRESPYYGLFIPLLKSLGPHRLMTSNYRVNRVFAGLGLCVSYLPKAYDPDSVSFLNAARDIEIGFIGRTKHKVYKHRRDLLRNLQKNLDIRSIRTAEGPEYNHTLNRIRFFISADAWFDEFMIKNYEALAAGCILCALPTTEEEAEILGFRDMENIVFYRTAMELKEKIDRLRQQPELADTIALAGRQLAETQHRLEDRSAEVARIFLEPISAPPSMNMRDKIRYCRLKVYHMLSGN